MAKVIASSVRKGNVLEINGKLCAVMTAENIHPGKGTPVTHLVMRRIADGVKVEERYRTTDTVERAYLEEKEYNYLYCAVYGDGAYTVRHRFGGELHTLVERRASGAVRRADASGKASNAIGWMVDEGNVSCVINGTTVSTFPRSLLIGPGKLESTDGIVGLHVDRDVAVRISGFGVKH